MRVLLLDHERSTARALEAFLPAGVLFVAESQTEGLHMAAAGGWDLILLDAGFAGSALDLLPRLQGEEGPALVVLASHPSVELALEAIRRGAHDVLPKPPPPARLREILGARSASRRVRALPAGDGEPPLVGGSPEMLGVFKAVARAAPSDATVLVLGESGTGKELVARVLHARGPRGRGPFVAINCAAIPENLLESELFGHEKGAFTGAIGRRIGRFERATGGTLFLDEIGDMSIALQSKILRALQEREIERVGGASAVPIDVRVIAATNRDLPAAVEAGRFREDLYYRLAVVLLRLPPLRGRGADLERLAEHFAAFFARRHGRPIRGIAEETLEVLRAHAWPGNIRQLRNAVERAVVMCEGEVLLPEHLPGEVRDPEARPGEEARGEEPVSTLAEMERRMIRRALRETGGTLTLAAERLGIHRNTLRRKIARYGIGEE